MIMVVLLLVGCADRAQIDLRVVRVDQATADAAALSVMRSPTLTISPPSATATETPLDVFPRDLTIDAPQALLTPADSANPSLTFAQPNAQPPPFGLSIFPPGYTPESVPPAPPATIDAPDSTPTSAPTLTVTPTPVALIAAPPLTVCSIVNRRAASVEMRAAANPNAVVVAALESGTSARVIVRSPNNWFLVDFDGLTGYIDGAGAELYGDCLGIAIPGDNYAAPAALAPELFLDCRFAPSVENALVEIGNLRAPLDAEREYPIVRADAGRYLILIAPGIGAWVGSNAGVARGDCARVGQGQD